MNAPAQDIRDGGSVWMELSWQRDVLREKIDLSNLATLPVGLEPSRDRPFKSRLLLFADAHHTQFAYAAVTDNDR